MDKTELLNLITDEDIVKILTEEFGAIKGSENSEQIIFSSICHGSNSFKLYWYKTSKTFHCYVCSESWSLFDFIGMMLCLSFSESYKWLCNYKGVKNTRQQFRGFKSRDSENKDLEFLKLHSYKPTQNEIVLPEYSDKVLRNFDKAIEESWYEEGINNEEVLDKFEILYNYYDGSMIIPYFSEDGTHLNGIMRRSFNKEDVDNGRKYMPLEWNRITYKFNKRLVLYGYHENKENIDKLHKCILYEAEKSVLKLSCYKGLENGIGLGLARIVRTIMNDSNEILTVSAYLNGEYGHKDIYIGVPAVINSNGARELLNLKLSKENQEKLDNSCKILSENMENIRKALNISK